MVLLFTRLANLKRDIIARLTDKRRARRHPVGAEFPLKATVSLTGSDDLGRVRKAAAGSGRDWSGRLLNFSATGVSLALPSAAVTVRGEPTMLTLVIESHRLPVPAEVAHFRVYNTHSVCGLKLRFEDDTQRTAYLQLLEAVATGAAFKPFIPTGFVRNPPGLVREQYRSESDAALSVWRNAKSREIDSFELRLHDHVLRGDAARPGLVEVYTKPAPRSGKVAWSAPRFGFSPGEHAEIRRLCRWVIPNLSRSVPADARKFLLPYAAPPPKWEKPPVRNGALILGGK